MKKLFYTLTILLAVISFSCEEDFSPNDEFSEKYILFGSVSKNPDMNYDVYIKLLNSYETKGDNSYDDKIYPQIANADVILKSSGYEYELIEDTVINYVKDSVDIYYSLENIKFTQSNQKFSVVATLPNGKVLSANTTFPEAPDFTYSYQFDAITTDLDTFKVGDTWIITWDSDGQHLYFPSLKLVYYVWNEVINDWLSKTKEIPLRYVDNQPVYPTAMWDSKLEYSFDAIDSTMAQVSAGATDKSKYKIGYIRFNCKTLDENFSRYYSSTNGYLDEYSVRLDESTYSNISGGIGVFGSSSYIYQTFPVDEKYAAKYGLGVGN